MIKTGVQEVAPGVTPPNGMLLHGRGAHSITGAFYSLRCHCLRGLRQAIKNLAVARFGRGRQFPVNQKQPFLLTPWLPAALASASLMYEPALVLP